VAEDISFTAKTAGGRISGGTELNEPVWSAKKKFKGGIKMDEIKRFLMYLTKEELISLCASMMFQNLVNAADLAKALSIYDKAVKEWDVWPTITCGPKVARGKIAIAIS
jgi:hypothetical protein